MPFSEPFVNDHDNLQYDWLIKHKRKQHRIEFK